MSSETDNDGEVTSGGKTKRIRQSLRKAWAETKEFLYVCFVIGGVVYIPVAFVLGTAWLWTVVGDLMFTALMLLMSALFIFVISFWFNYFGDDDPLPPLVP